jgi:hypothetical protein
MNGSSKLNEESEIIKQFAEYDFDSDKKFIAYLEGIYPEPKGLLLKKFKRKFFKKNINPELDVNFDNINDKVRIGIYLISLVIRLKCLF